MRGLRWLSLLVLCGVCGCARRVGAPAPATYYPSPPAAVKLGQSSPKMGLPPTVSEEGIPAFPVHPPAASARYVLPELSLPGGGAITTMGEIDRVLSSALDQVGYGTKGYYSYPGGFALATQLEQIYPDGRCMAEPDRYKMLPPVPPMISWDWFKGIVVPREGYFRVIVFLVTDQPIVESGDAATQSQAEGWPRGGATGLPAPGAPTSPGVRVTAFIYEFRNTTAGDVTKLKLLNEATLEGNEALIDGRTHLVESGLWRALGLR